MLSVFLSEYGFPERSWLLKVGIWVLELVSTDFALDWELAPCIFWILLWSTQGVWLIVGLTTVIAVDSSSTISDVASDSSSVRAVDWDLFVVLSESVSMGIWVREKSTLEHLIHGWLNTWNQVAWGESRLFDLGVIVFWVSVQSHSSNLMQWVVLMRPDLSNIQNIESIVLSILLRHQLNIPGP